MSPHELRAFRESLGLSRRELAGELFISEPTLVRWEKGQGGPRDFHLRILREIKERAHAARSLAEFDYEASPEGELPRQTMKQMIVETLSSIGAGLLEDVRSEDGLSWSLSFSTGWGDQTPASAILTCEGSHRPERPSIDFALTVPLDADLMRSAGSELQRLCIVHRLCFEELAGSEALAGLKVHQRTYDTACNRETILHVVGNFRAYWKRIENHLKTDGSPAAVGPTQGREATEQAL